MRISLGIALVLVAASASAAPVVPVIVVSEKPGEPAWLGAAAQDMAGLLKPEAVSDDDLADRLGLVTPPSVQAIEERFRMATEAFFRGDLETAETEARNVLGILERHEMLLLSIPSLRTLRFRTSLYLFRVLKADRKEDLARTLLESALFTHPDLKPDPVEFPPDVVSEVQEAQVRLAALGYGSIDVKLSGLPGPRACTAFVDQQQEGPLPIRIQTAAGDHSVAVVCEGGSVFQRKVHVSARGEESLSAEPVLPSILAVGSAGGVWAKASPEDRDRAFLVQGWKAGDLMGVERVVTVGLFRQESGKGSRPRETLVASLVEVATRRLVRLAAVDIDVKDRPPDRDKLEAVAAFLADGKTSRLLGRMVPPLPAVPGEAESAPKAWYDNPAAWTAIGLGLGMVTAGVILYSLGSDRDRSYEHASYGLFGAGAPLAAGGMILFSL